MMILNATIGAAGTFNGSPFQIRTGPVSHTPIVLGSQKFFTYGAGGTSVDTFLQTSLDGGGTWADVVHWAQNLLASDARPFAATVSATMLASPAAPIATTDGTSTVNTTVFGVFGMWWRAKYIVAGTYTGLTTLRVDVEIPGLVPAGLGA